MTIHLKLAVTTVLVALAAALVVVCNQSDELQLEVAPQRSPIQVQLVDFVSDPEPPSEQAASSLGIQDLPCSFFFEHSGACLRPPPIGGEADNCSIAKAGLMN